MGAGTFLSHRRFWEIRQLQGGADSRPPFSSLASVPAWSQARLSSLCPQGGSFFKMLLLPQTMLSILRPSGLHAQVSSSLRTTPHTHTHIPSPTLSSSLRAALLTWSFSHFLRQCSLLQTSFSSVRPSSLRHSSSPSALHFLLQTFSLSLLPLP